MPTDNFRGPVSWPSSTPQSEPSAKRQGRRLIQKADLKTNQKTRGEHTQKNTKMKRLWIEEFNTPWIAFGGLEIDTVERKGAFVVRRASGGDL